MTTFQECYKGNLCRTIFHYHPYACSFLNDIEKEDIDLYSMKHKRPQEAVFHQQTEKPRLLINIYFAI